MSKSTKTMCPATTPSAKSTDFSEYKLDFMNVFFDKYFKDQQVMTDLIRTNKRTKKGNPKYELLVYSHDGRGTKDKLLGKFTAIRCISPKTTKEYFTISHRL